MNKKEMSELKKNFNTNSDFLVINKVLTAFVDHEKQIRCLNVQPFVTISDDERTVIVNTLKSVFNTKVGKNTNEYKFTDISYHEKGAQIILYNILSKELTKDSEAIQLYMERLVNNISYESAYEVITAFCTYTVKTKRNDGVLDADVGTSEYKFMVTAICPAHTGDTGFVFNMQDNVLIKKENDELLVAKEPTDGFIFPTFSNRMSDVNTVMYYTKNMKKPNISIVEDFLQCPFTFSADTEINGFKTLLTDCLGTELNYNIITSVNNALQDIILTNTKETEIPTINSAQIKTILKEFGVSNNRLDLITPTYNNIFTDIPLRVVNLIDTNTSIKTDGIKLTVSKSSVDKIKTVNQDGRKCILIDLDEDLVEINGVPVNLS